VASFIYLFLVFLHHLLHPKSSIGLKPRVRFFECVFLIHGSNKSENQKCVFFIYQQPQT
jgi:hypothetical protein